MTNTRSMEPGLTIFFASQHEHQGTKRKRSQRKQERRPETKVFLHCRARQTRERADIGTPIENAVDPSHSQLMLHDDTFTSLENGDAFPTAAYLISFAKQPSSVDDHSVRIGKKSIPVNGATLDLTPPTPRPIRKNDAIRPPKPAPASSACGIDVKRSNRIPQRYIL